MNSFELAVYAIAAIALIFIFFELIMPYMTTTNGLAEIKSGIQNAQISTNLGKTINLGVVNYAKNTTIYSDSFDKTKMLVAIECIGTKNCCAMKDNTNAACAKAISWNNTFFSIEQGKGIQTYVRCTKIGSLPLCKIFLDGAPAQAKIEKITGDKTGKNISLTLKNTGTLALGGGDVKLMLYKKGANGWEKTDYLAQPKGVDLILAGEETNQKWEINPTNAGDYKAEFTFEAQDAGFDTNTTEFSKAGTEGCTATTTGETLIDPDTNAYKEMHHCTGCAYAYECASAWEAKEPGKVFNPETMDTAYCTKQNYDGAC